MRRNLVVLAVLAATVLGLAIGGHFVARHAVDVVYRECGGGEHVPTKQITWLRTAVEMFRRDHGRYPAGLGELGAPPSGPPYASDADAQRDPWGRPWTYTAETRPDGVLTVRLGTLGPDGAPGTEDDCAARWLSTPERVGKIEWGRL